MTTKNREAQKMDSPDLHNVLLKFAGFFQEMSGEANRSAEILESNVTTEFARQVQEMLTDPLALMIKTYASAEESIIAVLRNVVRGLIKRNSSLVSSAWQVSDTEASLEFVIVLKEYNLQNRSVFNEFLTDYECTGLGSRLPIVFRYIPERLASGIISEKAVKLEMAA